jgi:sugar O-acyltransferase (sialic acid O-acetyltransferase NeuD family)
MSQWVFFGIGSPIVVEFVETSRRLGHAIVGGIANRDTPSFLPEVSAAFAPDRAPAYFRQAACLCPLFTPANRYCASREAEHWGFSFPAALVDPTAILASDVKVGGGSFVNAGVVVGASTVIGRHVLVNRSASIGHHVRLEDFSSIGPGAILAGSVTIGVGAMIGAGTIILPKVSVGEHAIVAAGSLVVRDVAARTKVMGQASRIADNALTGFSAISSDA